MPRRRNGRDDILRARTQAHQTERRIAPGVRAPREPAPSKKPQHDQNTPVRTRSARARRAVTIIVVDDHGDWRDSIAEYIQDLGLDKAILTAGSLAELDDLLLTVTPAILVLDAMLPDGDGLARVSHLRTTYPSMGIVMLTGRLLSEDKVSGLSLGADHYLTKPVNLAELGATLVSLSRRLRVVPAADLDDTQSGAWRFDPARRTLTSPGQVSVDITDAESRLIGALIQAAPLPLTRARLVEALGASAQAYDTHRLDAHMHRLRRKLRAHTGGDIGIRTVYGVGYVCTSPVTIVGSLSNR